MTIYIIKMDVKLVSFILILTVVLLKAEVNLWGDLEFFRKAILNNLFPKDPDIMRVRKPEDVKIEQNNVTILNFHFY